SRARLHDVRDREHAISSLARLPTRNLERFTCQILTEAPTWRHTLRELGNRLSRKHPLDQLAERSAKRCRGDLARIEPANGHRVDDDPRLGAVVISIDHELNLLRPVDHTLAGIILVSVALAEGQPRGHPSWKVEVRLGLPVALD